MATPFELLLIHHSHTDIGYTDPQARILRRHVHFLRRAMEICGRRPEFRWQCECFWPVEKALEVFDDRERAAFTALVRDGRIGLSANPLNFSELTDEDLLQTLLDRHAGTAAGLGTVLHSAMTADINGVGRGWARAMLDHDVENWFTCIHTHHGMYPLGCTQIPFHWEMPDGRRLLVWNGEHYHLGNEMGLAPDAGASYLTKDECDADAVYRDWWKLAETRIRRYCAGLVERSHPYDFAPLMISGLRTDNGPPSEAILDAVERWNGAHGDDVRVSMTTLDAFFERLRAESAEIPVHRGDWPDWWSDGPSGDAPAVRLHRAAVRDRRRLAGLRAMAGRPDHTDDALDDDLALFAEHTFSHSDAMNRPWDELVQAIGGRKRGFAASARDRSQALVDEACEALGAGDLDHGRPLAWRVVNPLGIPVRGLARMTLGHYEYRDLELERGLLVMDEAGRPLTCQFDPVPLGLDVCVALDLAPGQMRDLRIEPNPDGTMEAWSASDTPGPDVITTPHMRLEWSVGEGITAWDTPAGSCLLRPDRPHAPFTLVHQLTPVPDREGIGAVRGAMGLDRRGADVHTSVTAVTGGRLVDDGPLWTELVLELAGEACDHAELALRIMKSAPRVDATVRFHAPGRWAPENWYAALPFSAGEEAVTWLDRSGWPLQPRRDQVPGTLIDYYSLQNGWASLGSNLGVAVGMIDGPLLQLGPLAPGERLLAGDPRLVTDPAQPLAWLMTNYWETNFQAHLGGFHEFRFVVEWREDWDGPEQALAACRAGTHGLMTFRRAGRGGSLT